MEGAEGERSSKAGRDGETKGDAHVKAMERMPPPAPARAWATLSFWGMTGLDCDMLNNFW